MNAQQEIDAVLAELLTQAPPALSEAVMAKVSEAPTPVRPLLPRWMRAGVAIFGGLLCAMAALLGMGTELQAAAGLSPAVLVFAMTCFGATLLLTSFALREGEPLAPVSATPRFALALLIGLLLSSLAIFDDFGGDGLVDWPGVTELVGGARSCLVFGSLFEIGPVLLIFFLLARGSPPRPIRAGLLAGLAASGWSIFVLTLHCPSGSAWHVILFHLGVALVWGLLGALLGRYYRDSKRRKASTP